MKRVFTKSKVTPKSVSLYPHQWEYLQHLAMEMDISVSKLIRRLVDQDLAQRKGAGQNVVPLNGHTGGIENE